MALLARLREGELQPSLDPLRAIVGYSHGLRDLLLRRPTPSARSAASVSFCAACPPAGTRAAECAPAPAPRAGRATAAQAGSSSAGTSVHLHPFDRGGALAAAVQVAALAEGGDEVVVHRGRNAIVAVDAATMKGHGERAAVKADGGNVAGLDGHRLRRCYLLHRSE